MTNVLIPARNRKTSGKSVVIHRHRLRAKHAFDSDGIDLCTPVILTITR